MTPKQKARELNDEKTTDIAHQIICCEGCYQLGKNDRDKEILKFIETERDNGNIEPEMIMEKEIRGFSAGLCLSKLIKMLERK